MVPLLDPSCAAFEWIILKGMDSRLISILGWGVASGVVLLSLPHVFGHELSTLGRAPFTWPLFSLAFTSHFTHIISSYHLITHELYILYRYTIPVLTHPHGIYTYLFTNIPLTPCRRTAPHLCHTAQGQDLHLPGGNTQGSSSLISHHRSYLDSHETFSYTPIS